MLTNVQRRMERSRQGFTLCFWVGLLSSPSLWVCTWAFHPNELSRSMNELTFMKRKNSRSISGNFSLPLNSNRLNSGFGSNIGGGGFDKSSTKNNKKSSAGGNTDFTDKLRSISSTQGIGAGSKPLRQAALAFDRIRKERGREACCDVYIRSPLNSPTTFWFVGKVASESAPIHPKMEENDSSSPVVVNDPDHVFVAACLSQKRIIMEYSRLHLRPQNFGGRFASALELWLAPADSEMDVAQNKVTLTKVLGSASDLPESFSVATVGYNPEIYVGDEVKQGGLRVERDEEGQPSRPVFDVNQSVENQ